MESREILRRALNLSLAIYRVTEKLPKGEILISQMRQVANEIISDLMFGDFNVCRKKINLLRIYFEIARSQNWIQEVNWLILISEYLNLAGDLGDLEAPPSFQGGPEKKSSFERGGKKEKKPRDRDKEADDKFERLLLRLTARQKKIFQAIKEKGSLTAPKVASLIGPISVRTVLRELDCLVKIKALERDGANKNRKYFLKK